jgi:hypothetical protein
MRFLKGDIKTARENAKKKPNRIVIISISKHSTDIPDPKRPGDLIKHDDVYYMVTAYMEGEPRHYDTEEIRIQTFKLCLKKLEPLIKEGIKEISIQHLFASCSTEQWKKRKEILKEFEKEHGCQILIYVPQDISNVDKKDNDDDGE